MVSEKIKELSRQRHKELYPNADAYTFERGYVNGYVDAVECILSQLQEKYDMAEKQDGRKVTCMVSKLHTPQERYERHQGYLSGLLVAIGMVKKAKEE